MLPRIEDSSKDYLNKYVLVSSVFLERIFFLFLTMIVMWSVS